MDLSLSPPGSFKETCRFSGGRKRQGFRERDGVIIQFWKGGQARIKACNVRSAPGLLLSEGLCDEIISVQ